jgi:hypothetical protein
MSRAALCFFGQFCTAAMIFLNFVIGEVLDADKSILCMRAPNKLVQFGLQRGTISILGVLDNKYHKEGHNGLPVLMISCQVSE